MCAGTRERDLPYGKSRYMYNLHTTKHLIAEGLLVVELERPHLQFLGDKLTALQQAGDRWPIYQSREGRGQHRETLPIYSTLLCTETRFLGRNP